MRHVNLALAAGQRYISRGLQEMPQIAKFNFIRAKVVFVLRDEQVMPAPLTKEAAIGWDWQITVICQLGTCISLG